MNAPTRMRRRVVLAIVVALFGACATMPSARRPAYDRRLTFSILEDYDKGDDLAAIQQDFALFRELGITTWRGSFGWDDYEPARGRYDFEWLHRFVDLADRDGITLRPYLSYTPAWAARGGRDGDVWNDPPARLDDWTAFVEHLASDFRRHRNLVSYEIYNEENVTQWWDGDAAAYREVLQQAAAAVRRAAPGVQVLFGGMTFADLEWLEAVCAGGAARAFDVIPFHAYPETWTPPGVDLERYLGPAFPSAFAAAADRACGRKPIWINETGFATTERKSEQEQAAWWARAIATYAATPRIEHVGVYEIKDLAPEREAIGGTPNYHLGITRVDRSRKAAFATIQMLVRSFGTMPFAVEDERIRLTPDSTMQPTLFAHLFEFADRRHLLVAWTKQTAVTVSIGLPHRARRATERLLDGSARAFTSFDGVTLAGVALTPGAVRVFELE